MDTAKHIISTAWDSTLVRFALFGIALAGAPVFLLSMAAASLEV